MRDIKHNLGAVQAFPPAAHTANVTGGAVDTLGFNAAMAVVEFGTVTDGTHTPALNESADGSTWNAVAAGDMLGSFAAGASNTVQRVGYVGNLRYLQVDLTVAGATTGAVASAVVILGHPASAPVA